MMLACVVFAHREPRQLARLLDALRHPQVRIYLHIDRRASLAPFRHALAEACLDTVTLLQRRASRWGGIEIVDAALDGLARARADGCDYCILLSGQDFPLRSVDELVTFYEQARERSYVENWPLPTPRWRYDGRYRTDFYSFNVLGRRETSIPRGEDTSYLNVKGRTLNGFLRLRTLNWPRRAFPPYLRAFGGGAWLNLSRSAMIHILDYLDEHPDYRRYHEYTLLPDELFFHSILLGTSFADQHEVLNDSLRFTIWPASVSHPRILTSRDLPTMLASEKLFARKFDPAIDDGVLARLADHIGR